jgi:C4-dicarboxylate transporter, DctM subunit
MEALIYLGLITFFLLGVPIFIIMSLFALFAFTFQDGGEISFVCAELYRITQASTLSTIPLFTFAGYVLAESKTPQRLVHLAQSALGWLPGGVAIVSLVICAFFTAFTGASGVTIIALGGLLFPILSKEGYSEKFSLGLITTSGSLGLLFPPSLPIILYGIVAGVDIDKLFKAGIVPGALLIAVLSVWALMNGSKGTASRTPFVFKDFMTALKNAKWECVIPIVVLGGIYGGITTPTEAAAITAFYVIIMECFIYKDVNLFNDVETSATVNGIIINTKVMGIPNIIKESMTLVGAILLILACSLGLTNYIVDEEIPMKILDMVRSLITSKLLFLVFLNIFLLVVGCLMDIFSAIIVVVPIIIPIATEYGVDPIHLAIIFLTNLEIGYITPPVGINLFIASSRFNKPITELYKASFSFLLIMLFALMLITYIPSLSLFWFD